MFARRRWSYLLDWTLLLLLTFVLVRPLLKAKYVDLWGSIESTFIADARFLKDNWVHPNWQPNWYCGTRTDYVYPPALRYGTAVIMKVVPAVIPAKAYHLYVGFFYCFGIAAVYLFTRWGSGSRLWGIVAALATAIVSPSYLLLPELRDTTIWHTPYRYFVLTQYGEGPHMTAVAWLPIALLFSFRAMQQWRPASLALASIACAFVVSNNFYGATALAMLFPILAWSIYVTHRDIWLWPRALAIPLLAYGLIAFWLVPSYLDITVRNMRFVSTQGNMWSAWAALFTLVAFVLISDRYARGRREAAYTVFVSGALVFFLVAVVGHFYLNFRIIGEPSRLVPELDWVMILFAVEMLRRFATNHWRKAVAAVLVLYSFSFGTEYLKNRNALIRTDPTIDDQVEYQMQDWMAKNMPHVRAMTAGGVRFWYNVWNDLQQIGGGSEQGLLNPQVVPPQWEILLGEHADLSLLWLKILGADAILVNEKHSKDYYRDYQFPEKFRGKLDVLHDDGAGNIIYKVPRRYPGLARVVDRARFNALPKIPGNGEIVSLTAWNEVLENGPEAPANSRWEGTDRLIVQAPVAQGQSVFVQISYDSNWKAYRGSQRLITRNSPLGFLVIDAPPGNGEIRLEFPTPFSNIIGRILTFFSLLVAGFLLWPRR